MVFKNLFKRKNYLVDEFKFNKPKLARNIKKNCHTKFMEYDDNGERVTHYIEDIRVKYRNYLIFNLYKDIHMKNQYKQYKINIGKCKTYKDIDKLIIEKINK